MVLKLKMICLPKHKADLVVQLADGRTLDVCDGAPFPVSKEEAAFLMQRWPGCFTEVPEDLQKSVEDTAAIEAELEAGKYKHKMAQASSKKAV